MTEKIPKKPAEAMYTSQQWQAIYDQGNNILVSASAGSGKTAVLVRRVIEKIQRQNISVDQLLVVTFTEAAASEMKQRIQSALQEAISESQATVEKNYFGYQLSRLPLANISTLHAFCARVIQRFFYLIDLDPNYRMLTDETETILLKEEVWDEIREASYENNSEIFYRLTENFSNDRDDQGLEDLILSLYSFARANADPEAWLDSLLALYQVTDISQSPFFAELLKPQMLNKLTGVANSYQKMIDDSRAIEGLEKITTLAENEQQQIINLMEAIMENRLDDAFETAQQLQFPTYPSRGIAKETKEIYEIELAAIKKIRDTNKKFLQEKFIPDYFSLPFPEQTTLLQEAKGLMMELIRVEKEFIRLFSEKKMSKGMLDFNDLEHFALKILTTEVEGSFPAKNYYNQRFSEVLVDEYQDTNQLQETILQTVAQKQPGNMFMVGDVKQSIYGFRLADPTLFIDKYESFAPADDFQQDRRIILPDNFRSRKEVLNFTNLIFKQLMDKELGQIPYDEAAELVNGAKYFPESKEFATELMIFEKGELPEELEDKADGEILMVANKIRQIIDSGFDIYDKKTKQMRPATYADIVLLTPTRKHNLTIIETFKQLEIPLAMNDAQNYFQSTELRTMVALMQIIDNPYQDIPLAAVLRSPIVSLTDEELAEIRLAAPQTDFYTAVKKYQQENTYLAKKLQDFQSLLDNWRELAHRISLVDLLLLIYQETAYLDYVLGMPAGPQRHANLMALVDRAQAYEKTSYRGLYQFIRFVEKMQEKNKDLAEPPAHQVGENVSVMTVHASKGLEFPLVFLMDLSRPANVGDTKGRYLFDEHGGMGIKFIEPVTRVEYKTLAYQGLRDLKKNKLLAEEMRKLYVALTRAEQKLFLVGSYKDQADALKKWSPAATNQHLVLETSLREGQGIAMDWIGQSLFRHPLMEKFQQEYPVTPLPQLQNDPTAFNISFINAEKLMAEVSQLQPKLNQVIADPHEVNLEKIMALATYQYPYPEATMTTNYQSVSELKRMYDDPDNKAALEVSFDELSQQQRYRFTADSLKTPQFLAETSEIKGSDIGTATHLVMQLLDLKNIPTKEGLEKLIKKLTVEKTLAPEVVEKINLENILWFFTTSLGKKIVADQLFLQREEPFAMLLEASDVFKDYPRQDEMLIHGIIDGYLELEDQIILYDLKTDYYSDGNQNKLIKRYSGQLYLYKEALEKAKNKKVTSLNLVFLSGHKVIDLLKLNEK